MKAFAALVRNDNDGLEVRRFDTAHDAAVVSANRELVTSEVNEPAGILAVLPAIMETLRALNARKLRLVPIAGGGFDLEVIETNRLYVSRQELAEMLPMFGPKTDRTRIVDELKALGIPHVNATGSAFYNVPKLVAWLELHFGVGGKMPAKGKA